jgi:SAM-dependent methyltransferase
MQIDVVDLTRPLPLFHARAIKYGLARLLLRTAGRLSKGISIGCRHGFDSGVMLDHVYENRAQGSLLIGRWIDRLYLDSEGWAGIRARGELLRDTLVSRVGAIAARKRAQGLGAPVIVDLACGGGRYLIAALRALKEAGIRVEATLRDYRLENVARARANAARAGVRVTIEMADAFSDADLAGLPAPDLVVVSGLHEIITDDARVSRHFEQLAELLRPGGSLVATLQPRHPQLELIARVLTTHEGRPWAMRLRSTERICALAQAAGFTIESVAMEPREIFGVLVAKKP